MSGIGDGDVNDSFPARVRPTSVRVLVVIKPKAQGAMHAAHKRSGSAQGECFHHSFTTQQPAVL